jgi:aryl-phospho-beta-D-glucosidase BglC (GH1 family)
LDRYISDAWDTNHYVDFVGRQDTFVVLDHHLYRCFTQDDARQSGDQHAQTLCTSFGGQMSSFSDRAHGSIVIGEFSAALNPGSMPRGCGAGEQDRQRRVFLRAELDLFERTCAGWYFWTLKKGDGWDAGWSAKDAARAEILPGWVGGMVLKGGDAGESLKDQVLTEAYREWNPGQSTHTVHPKLTF